jgi:ketosteroid isomerase-like protein
MRELTHGDAQDLLQAYKRAWEKRDVDAAMELYAPEAEHRDHPFGDPFVGQLAIRGMWNDIAINEAHVEFDAERVWVSGSTVLASWHAAYTDRTNADRVRMRGFLTMELDEQRRVRRVREWPVSKVVGKDSTLVPEPSAQEDRRGG